MVGDCMTTYSIIRFYKEHDQKTIKTGLTLAEAKEHCQDDETSAATCELEENIEHTAKFGRWFDAFVTEE